MSNQRPPTTVNQAVYRVVLLGVEFVRTEYEMVSQSWRTSHLHFRRCPARISSQQLLHWIVAPGPIVENAVFPT